MDDGTMVAADAAPEAPPLIPYGWLRALLCVILWVSGLIGLTVVAAVGVGIYVGATGGEPPSAEAFQDLSSLGLGILALVQVVTFALTLAVVWPLRWLFDRRSLVSLGLTLRGYGAHLAQGLAWGAGLIVFGFVVLMASGALAVTADHDAISLPLFLGYLAVLVLVSLNEELLIRGYILSNLMESFSGWLALLISALVFAAFHLFNANLSVLSVVNLVLAGLVLGVYYLHRRNLWFSIGMHLTWNLFQGPVFGFEVSGLKTPSLIGQTVDGSDLLTGGEFGLEGSLLTTFFLIIATAVIHLQFRGSPPAGMHSSGTGVAPERIDTKQKEESDHGSQVRDLPGQEG
jgi:membrane protease YdiL (CAAX protease family)